MTHKEFYIWLEGYLYGKLENKHIDISIIVEKMSYVKEEKHESIKITPFERMPIPVNPIPKDDDPYSPPSWDITFENKQQLND
jgi:hypothetical protein